MEWRFGPTACARGPDMAWLPSCPCWLTGRSMTLPCRMSETDVLHTVCRRKVQCQWLRAGRRAAVLCQVCTRYVCLLALHTGSDNGLRLPFIHLGDKGRASTQAPCQTVSNSSQLGAAFTHFLAPCCSFLCRPSGRRVVGGHDNRCCWLGRLCWLLWLTAWRTGPRVLQLGLQACSTWHVV